MKYALYALYDPANVPGCRPLRHHSKHLPRHLPVPGIQSSPAK